MLIGKQCFKKTLHEKRNPNNYVFRKSQIQLTPFYLLLVNTHSFTSLIRLHHNSNIFMIIRDIYVQYRSTSSLYCVCKITEGNVSILQQEIFDSITFYLTTIMDITKGHAISGILYQYSLNICKLAVANMTKG